MVGIKNIPRHQSAHPLRRFLEAGITATINTDDPGISGIDLPYEYNLAAPKAGLNEQQIHQAQRIALEVAFLTGEEKQALSNNLTRP
jgi:adenosine deaminase